MRRRLIAVLLIYQGNVVQTRKFRVTNVIGSARVAIEFLNLWSVDEIVLLEMSPSRDYLAAFEAILDDLSASCFLPMSVGGKIDSLEQASRYMRCGADKTVLNTAAIVDPALVASISRHFGAQACVVSIDARRNPSFPSGYEAVIGCGRQPAKVDAVALARRVEELGAGEIIVNSLERDGDKKGYELPLVRAISDAVGVPVVAMGGVGKWDDMVDGVTQGGAAAVAAGNIFHYTEHSAKKAKEHLIQCGLDFRKPAFYRFTAATK